jgi:hypothetical protein
VLWIARPGSGAARTEPGRGDDAGADPAMSASGQIAGDRGVQAPARAPRRSFLPEIFLAAFAGVLLEIAYTRVISFKLFYYYTYVVIGFAMLGIGSGAVLVALVPALRRAPLAPLLSRVCLAGAVSVPAGYAFVAAIELQSFEVWRSAAEAARLLATGFALFLSFAAIGVVIALLLSRLPERIAPLYFADLLGAGTACLVVVPLVASLGAPSCVFLSGAVLALASARTAERSRPGLLATSTAIAAALALGALRPGWLPDVSPDRSKALVKVRPQGRLHSSWGPVFRIDVTRSTLGPEMRLIHHDGMLGSTLHAYAGDAESLARFDRDPRGIPFLTPAAPPQRVLIIGAAGGHEVLAALHFGAEQIDAVELNPDIVELLTDVFPDYAGRLHENPRVRLVVAEGRSFLAASGDARWDLIFLVAPDTYAAMNAATSGAFVLSESYLYTREMVIESLAHLAEGGVLCVMFGEFNYQTKPNRSARFAATARAALGDLGIRDFGSHILVATQGSHLGRNRKRGESGSSGLELVTILVKKEPFSAQEVERFQTALENVPRGASRHLPGQPGERGPVNRVIGLPDAQLPGFFARYPYDVTPVSDVRPSSGTSAASAACCPVWPTPWPSSTRRTPTASGCC